MFALLNNHSLVYADVQTPASWAINMTIDWSPTFDLQQHPGFSLHPLFLCPPDPQRRTPPPNLFYTTNKAVGLASALMSLQAAILSNPLATIYAMYAFPAIVILEEDLSVEDVVKLASSNGQGVGLSLPLILMSPKYPTRLGVPPADMTLDLTGCVSCISMADSPQVHVYLTGVHLTGLQPLLGGSSAAAAAAAAGSGTTPGANLTLSTPGANLTLPTPGANLTLSTPSANLTLSTPGANLSLPLWAFRFNRSSTQVDLHNVTLTLPGAEFRMLLASLAAGGAGLAGLKVQVCRVLRMMCAPHEVIAIAWRARTLIAVEGP